METSTPHQPAAGARPRFLRWFATANVSITAADTALCDWVAGLGPAPDPRLLLAEHVAGQVTLDITAEAVRAADPTTRAFLFVVGCTVAGFATLDQTQAEADVWEIGYSVAPAWRGRGVGKRGVAALVRLVRKDPSVLALKAQTRPTNQASRRVLERNGFRRLCRRTTPKHGVVDVWRLTLQPNKA